MRRKIKKILHCWNLPRLNTAVLYCGLPLLVSASDVPPKKILFVGDSISVGVGASSPQKRFTTMAVKMLNQAAGKELYKEINTSVNCLRPVPSTMPNTRLIAARSHMLSRIRRGASFPL